MILTIEPCPVPSMKRCFQGKFKKAGMWPSLETNTPDNLSVGGTQLIFQEELVLKLRKVRMNSEKSFAKMDKNSDIRNRTRIEVDQLNFVVVKEPTEEVADREAKST
jgi:hypothetical protein